MATTHDPLAPTGATQGNESSGAGLKQRVSEAASHLKDAAGNYGRSAADQIDRNVHNAASAVEGAAGRLRSRSEGGHGKLSEAAQTAASTLDSTAHHLRDFDTRQLMTQFEDWTRKNAGLAIGGALAVGFLIGVSLRRDTKY